MNQALDDVVSITGMPNIGGRMPVQALARAMQRSHTLNNIQISQSQIGVLNTGSIERIDAAITISQGSDAALVGEQIGQFVEAVIKSNELEKSEKADIVDLLETLATEIVGKRKPALLDAVMKGITEKLSNTAALASAAQKVWDVLGPFLPR